MLFHEPAIGIFQTNPVGMNSFSCSSATSQTNHLQPVEFRGIADGAEGFGNLGNGHNKNPLYTGDGELCSKEPDLCQL